MKHFNRIYKSKTNSQQHSETRNSDHVLSDPREEELPTTSKQEHLSDPDGTIRETNELKAKAVKPPASSIEDLLSEYSDVFQGIGCFHDTGEEIKFKLAMDPEATPVAQRPQYLITYRNHLNNGLNWE